MEEVLEWCQLASPTRCTVVVCGGDGTVGWLLTTADKLDLKTSPLVTIFPLGTGKEWEEQQGGGGMQNPEYAPG